MSLRRIQYIRKYHITLTTKQGGVHTEESDYPSVSQALDNMLAKSRIQLHDLKEGQGVVTDVNIRVKCLLNRPKPRAPRRAPAVIAAEKAAHELKRQRRAAERERRAAERERWAAAQAELRKATQRRIRNQIDHAFASGQESGTEPVSKFITCDTCHAPAAFLYLSTPMAKGAVALDESAITNAVCAEHNYGANKATNPYHQQYWGHVAEIVPCSLLEFFYTGVRKIAIKTGVPA